ncbi:hypothetical protein JVU11DRAFT_4432 [Chiua virens]|nr:hypothetical protein JVU11DRAFT_4432 [Chiua virens]
MKRSGRSDKRWRPPCAPNQETRSELQEEVDRKQQEIARIQRDLERVMADFIATTSQLESRIAEMEKESHQFADELEGLQEQVVQARKEAEEEKGSSTSTSPVSWRKRSTRNA